MSVLGEHCTYIQLYEHMHIFEIITCILFGMAFINNEARATGIQSSPTLTQVLMPSSASYFLNQNNFSSHNSLPPLPTQNFHSHTSHQFQSTNQFQNTNRNQNFQPAYMNIPPHFFSTYFSSSMQTFISSSKSNYPPTTPTLHPPSLPAQLPYTDMFSVPRNTSTTSLNSVPKCLPLVTHIPLLSLTHLLLAWLHVLHMRPCTCHYSQLHQVLLL
jgi:hypothetical protein